MKILCAAICGLSGVLLLAGCDTYPQSTYSQSTYPSATPPASTAYVPPAEQSCIYTSRSYVSGTRITPPEIPGTTLQCVNGRWHSI